MKKDCAFQYATKDGEIYADTFRITRKQAEIMWEEYLPLFMDHVKEGRDPEMAIWVDMENDTHYHETEKHWCGEDFVVIKGDLYHREVI